MASYVGTARSNYIRVKDPDAFADFCEKWDLEILGPKEGLYAFLSHHENGIPGDYYDLEKDERVDGDFMQSLSEHVADGWVAVVREIGYEKMRYLVGYTLAVNAKGEVLDLNLDEIYDTAKRLGEYVTRCEY